MPPLYNKKHAFFPVIILSNIALTFGYTNSFAGRSYDSFSRSTFSSSVDSIVSGCDSVVKPLSDNALVMRVRSGRSRTAGVKGSAITQKNYERVKSSGRRGTKNFVDPNKLFVGNLAYDVTSEELYDWFAEQGLGEHLISCKVIVDWKTQKSKGFGFAQFTSPIYATSAMEFIHGKKLKGRVVRLNQGQKKKPDSVYLVKKEKQMEIKDKEDEIISEVTGIAGIIADNVEEVSADLADDDDDDDDVPSIRDLMTAFEYEDFDDDNLDGEDDDDDFEYDGVFEEEYEDDDVAEDTEVFKNREQRRKEAAANKRRRKKGKGFGN
mmetsp:Transcript_6714/g.9820  ORF Transcript_6714/g.9820 Transcript_6714/m.9820 type:complete len:322 (-) Transcript_6714:952-1917(-)|eukprot:CAMPEP_0196803154 /NCGR_PEP_ID=MMETSP1362-20130617/2560_1 /TAXON_ID=163516 /ORGANISM="Leptocylindrus danicus, Strain CCMP1856" /LENGTH=321 /DNA_ID=CAMNT_0042174599 /DNA_START=36 /DNA_END=1001 /DNA_ORIENTATION=+